MEFLLPLVLTAAVLAASVTGGYVLSIRAPRVHRWICECFFDADRLERMGL